MVKVRWVGTFVLFLGLLWLAPAAEAQTGFVVPTGPDHDRARLSGFAWRASLAGSLALEELSGLGGSIDIAEGLGFGDAQTGWLFDVNLAPGRRHRFILGVSGHEQTADSVLDFELLIGDTLVSIDEPVTTRLKLRELRGFYNLLIVVRRSVEAGFMIGGGWFDLQAAADSDVASVTATFNTPYPSLGANLMINPAGRVRAYAEFTGFPEVDIEDLTGWLSDLHGRVEVFLVDNVGVAIGYRDYRIELADEAAGLSFDLEWSGLTFGIQLRY